MGLSFPLRENAPNIYGAWGLYSHTPFYVFIWWFLKAAHRALEPTTAGAKTKREYKNSDP